MLRRPEGMIPRTPATGDVFKGVVARAGNVVGCGSGRL
ncbi:hypothetical protein NY78_3840 [Desulfovibrio sp. TomC]|nr:hypothetical protein NY78_3840 [Desulfovibrio sp. TomC]